MNQRTFGGELDNGEAAGAGAGGLSFAMATAAKRMTHTHARKDALNVVALSDMRALEVACVSIRQSPHCGW